MKILIISNTVWREEDNFGNTFSNIFKGLNNIEIAHIYCNGELPKNNIVSKYYLISNIQLIRSMFSNKFAGKTMYFDGFTSESVQNEVLPNKLNLFFKKYRFQIFFLIRELIWKLGKWKSNDLLRFIYDFNPNVIYCPICYSCYMCDLTLFVKSKLNIPLIGHTTDDVYSLKQFRLSPLYWIDRFFIRKKIKKLISHCEYVDTFTKIQKDEYEKIFGKKFNILYKSMDFSGNNSIKEYKFNDPLKFIYTGNISSGRWENLILIGKTLDEINKNKIKALMFVYTGTPITKKMGKLFNRTKSIIFMGSVSSDKIKEIQDNADILIHTESFKLKHKLAVRMSFSTKIVDYLYRKKCILAVGPTDVASIDYFINNDAGFVISDRNDILNKIEALINNKELIIEYGEKAWRCGERNHQESVIKERFHNNLKSVIKEYSENENITN